MDVAADNQVVRDKIREYMQRLNEKCIPVWRIYLFGSHAKGTAGKDSDIDVAVFLDREDIEGFPETVALMRLCWDIDLRIEPHVFARTDFTMHDPFISEIVTTGERLI